MTRHYPYQGRASDWWSHVGNLLRPIITMDFLRSFLRHFRGETSSGVAKCRWFSQAKSKLKAAAFKVEEENFCYCVQSERIFVKKFEHSCTDVHRNPHNDTLAYTYNETKFINYIHVKTS